MKRAGKNELKKFLLPRIVPIVILVLVMLMLQPQNLSKRIDNSISKAKIFLASANLDQDILGNAYPACLYDHSKCPFDEEEFLYKKIDASLDFVFLKNEPIDYLGLEGRIESADRFLKSILKDLPNKSIDYSYIDRSRERGDFALDLYCIIGWTYNDTTIYRIVSDELKSYGWANPNTTDIWRKIIDETWCISLLAQHKTDKNILKQQILLKEKEFRKYIKGNDTARDIVGGVHLLLMFKRMEEYGYDLNEFKDFIEFIKNFVEYNTASSESMKTTSNVCNNVLYTFVKIKYPNKDLMQELAENILVKQWDDGSWQGWYIPTEPRFKILATLRAIIALSNFKSDYL